MGDSQIFLGRGNRRAFMSGLRVGGNGNKKDQVGEGTETGERVRESAAGGCKTLAQGNTPGVYMEDSSLDS